MKSLISLVGMALVATSSMAAGSNQEAAAARKTLDALREIVATTQAWEHLTPRERLNRIQSARELEASTLRLVPENSKYAECRDAATRGRFYVLALNDLALLLDGDRTVRAPSSLIAPSKNAVDFGRAMGLCEISIS